MPLNKLRKPIFILFAMLLIVINLCAWSVSDYYLGNTSPVFSARNMGMGNTGVYDSFSPMAVFINPANLSMLDGKVGLTVNGLFTRNEDNRSIPLYNSFDAFLDDATYSNNINLYDDYGFAGYGKIKFNNYVAGLGIHYLPMINFKGDYNEEIRNNRNSDDDGYPEIIALNEINNAGNINALGFTLSSGMKFDNDKEAQIGITINTLDGQSEIQKSIRWTEWAIQQSIEQVSSHRNVLPDSVYTNKSDLKGSQIKIGTAIKLNHRFGIGIAYSPKSKFDRDSDIRIVYGPDTTMAIPSTSTNLLPVITNTTIKDKYILPSRFRVGFNYQPRNIMRTYFNAEVEYTTWTDVSNLFEDSWDLHVGVEHAVNNRIPLRLGFQAITEWQAMPNYSLLTTDGLPTIDATKIITPSISAGSSVLLRKNLVLDIGLSFSWREYQALDMFRDGFYDDRIHTGMTSYILWPNSHIMPTDRGWENPDKVRESFTQISTGLTWSW